MFALTVVVSFIGIFTIGFFNVPYSPVTMPVATPLVPLLGFAIYMFARRTKRELKA